MKKIPFNAYVATLAALTTPFVSLAHGGVDDGHVEEAIVFAPAGASALLQAFSSAWWGILAVSAFLTALLSFGVWKYLQVPQTKRLADALTPDVPVKT